MTTKKPERAEVKGRAESRIPHFKTIEEEEEFWDTHSTTEFEDEFERVTDVRFIVTRTREKKNVTIRMPQDAFERLCEQAGANGTAPDMLALLWIMERLVQSPRS